MAIPRLTKATEAIRSVRTGDLALITPLKLLAQLVQVRKRQLSGIRPIAHGEVYDLVDEQVAVTRLLGFNIT